MHHGVFYTAAITSYFFYKFQRQAITSAISVSVQTDLKDLRAKLLQEMEVRNTFIQKKYSRFSYLLFGMKRMCIIFGCDFFFLVASYGTGLKCADDMIHLSCQQANQQQQRRIEVDYVMYGEIVNKQNVCTSFISGKRALLAGVSFQ